MSDKSKMFLKDLKNEFSLNTHQAHEMIHNFHKEMEMGLAGEKSSLKMLPSFICPPKGTEKGIFLAIDLGGTNLRVLAVKLLGDGVIETVGVSRFAISNEVMTGTNDMFFDFIVGCIKTFFDENHITQNKYSLGFTFSFPVIQSSIDRGVLISWTKGFSVSGVEGRDVVGLLNHALIRNKMESIHISAILNDTVGTLAAGSYMDPLCHMGVILGTGTNACYSEKIKNIKKLDNLICSDEMIINMEWGGFDRLERNIYDETVDKNSQNPGEQRLEKMVSGMYLGEIAKTVIIHMIENGYILSRGLQSMFEEPYNLTTEQLSHLSSGVDIFKKSGIHIAEKDREIIREIACIVSKRSARIAATAIAAVVQWIDPHLHNHHHIAIDGSLFEKYSGYKENMQSMLEEIFGDLAKKITLKLTHDGSGIGAAVVSAIEAHKRS